MPARRSRRVRTLAVGAVAATTCLGLFTAPDAVARPSHGHGDHGHRATVPATYNQTYRPQLHYTPAKNWINDPNGLLFYKGVYHMFYQYNPQANSWGNMSWGHATSKDLVHWTEQPVAIKQTFNSSGQSIEDIFSGSAVIDWHNTTGFGTAKNPAMVAIYTSAYTAANPDHPNIQAQSIAYSLDEGKTWTKYAGNPVLNIDSANFRDPKVFWYEPAHEWRMVAVRATDHVVTIYGSKNLKNWTHLSDFGPTGAVGGVWECPDLFPMQVQGTHKTKWVMVVNINPGSIAGGSGGQYFVGEFDGKKFTSDDPASYTPPSGTTLQNFESGSFTPWTVTGTAFGTAPATGALAGQSTVTGYTGKGFADSFHSGDASTGTLTSPNFTISKGYLNFLIGGGNHPHVAGASLDPTQPAGTVFNDFEGTTWGQGWTATGSFAKDGPRAGTIGDQQAVSGYLGKQLVNTFTDHDLATGTITSPAFTISHNYINLLVGGGNHPWTGTGADAEAVNLVVDGQVVKTATGNDSEKLNWVGWDVSAYQGKQATIQIVDNNTSGWGHILADQITFAEAPAIPVSDETSVNLVVGGQVVRSATGNDSENLDWNGWDVRDLKGKTAHLEVIDNNGSGWGHLLVDDFRQADAPAFSTTQRAHWLDYGRDYYAASTFNGLPMNKRIQIAWMNNWDYAGTVPASPWRSAMSLPRQLVLKRANGSWLLASMPVKRIDRLAERPVVRASGRVLPGTATLHTSRPLSQTLKIDATFRIGTARQIGLNVRVGKGQKTVIGYDAYRGGIFVDRTASGVTDFSTKFASSEFAPLPAKHGVVTLTIYVDRSSVEVFADHGKRVITDLIFPDPSSTGVQVFAVGGHGSLDKLIISPMDSIWAQKHC